MGNVCLHLIAHMMLNGLWFASLSKGKGHFYDLLRTKSALSLCMRGFGGLENRAPSVFYGTTSGIGKNVVQIVIKPVSNAREGNCGACPVHGLHTELS